MNPITIEQETGCGRTIEFLVCAKCDQDKHALSEKLVSEQSDEINGVRTISWEDSSWKYLSLIGDEQVISLLHTKDQRILHCPEDCKKAEAVENCRPTTVPTWKQLQLFFRTITSVNQLSLYGAVAEIREEYESYHAGRPVVAFLVRAECDQHKRAFEQ